jgi:hypothetical protein
MLYHYNFIVQIQGNIWILNVWPVLKKHCLNALYVSVADYSFSMYTPSIIAAASIAAALDGLEWTVKSGCSLSQLLDRLHIITAIERVSWWSKDLAVKIPVVVFVVEVVHVPLKRWYLHIRLRVSLRCSVRISARTPPVLTFFFMGFLTSRTMQELHVD